MNDRASQERKLLHLLGAHESLGNAKAWASARLSKIRKRVEFTSINDPSEFSHLHYRNRSDVGSRLDLRLATSVRAAQLNKDNTKVSATSWVTLDQLMGSSAQAKEVKAVIKRIKDEVPDHLPVLTRFRRGVVQAPATPFQRIAMIR